MKAVVLAGGKGARLAPYTSVLPKPLMPIGDRAILEIVVEQLSKAGFTDIAFCVGHLAHLIEAVFNGGPSRGVSITYVREDEPLGTAGPLRLLAGLKEPFLAMNGDVLTTLDYRKLVQHHRKAGNVLTIATHQRTTGFDYGVLHVDLDPTGTGKVTGYEEKPEFSLIVSMGVYVLDPRAVAYIPDGYFDIPDLVDALLTAGEPVGAYLFDGFWLDIGRHEDYEQATAAWEQVGAAIGR